ncbi:hypothetical protein V5O48_012026 [Marasmius crinis-equi]|uniref:Protein-S-isoprenylcysteine O-methyltransferase n=1 Tax=Marasmius crinis-equi TaxID=585013 RepID=A0ABR3F420_9AGAR
MEFLPTLSLVLQLALVGSSAILYRLSGRPPNTSGSQPQPPPTDTPSRERVDTFVSKWMPLSAYVMRKEYYIATLFEFIFILESKFPELKVFLRRITPSADDATSSLSAIRLMALTIGVAGCALRLWCYDLLGSNFVWQTSAPTSLVTVGPYSIVRHPSYTGLVMTSVGLSAYYLLPGSWIRESGFVATVPGTAAIGFWIVNWVWVTVFLVVLRIDNEDEVLEKQFGKEWRSWRDRVRSRVIPGIW